MRLLILSFIAVVLWVALETWVAAWRVRRREAAAARRAREVHAAESARPASITLVRCARCGTHIPQGNALSAPSPAGDSTLHYCSERCRGAGR